MKNTVREKYEAMEPRKIVTISNAISLLRAFLALPIIYLLNAGQMEMALLVMLIAMFTDLLDGWLARINHTITEVGKMLDPLADKIVIFSVLIFMVVKEINDIPWWFLALLIGRDFIISFLGMYMLNNRKVSPQANKMGKVSIVFTSAVILSFLYADQYLSFNIKEPLLYTAVVFLSISLIQYCYTYIQVIRKGADHQPKQSVSGKSKLSLGLAKTEKGIASKLPLIRKFMKVEEDVLEQIEETLLTTDLGVDLTEKLLDKLRKVKKSEAAKLQDILKEEMKSLIHTGADINELDVKPKVIFFVGINGTGKNNNYR